MFGSKWEEDVPVNPDRYFKERLERSSLVCQRFPDGIDFHGKDVIDVGSGFGPLSVYAARNGAKSVVGIDPDPESVATARELLMRHAPELRDRIKFRNIALEELDSGFFDLGVSMAVFEHVPDPAFALKCLSSRMKPGGKVFLGIGPLYRAPWGDHRRTRAPLQGVFPWSHLVFSDKWLIERRNNREAGREVSSVPDLGLNCLRLADYQTAFEQSGMRIDWWQTNVTENHLITSLLNLGRSLPGFQDLLAVNLYAVLKKPNNGL